MSALEEVRFRLAIEPETMQQYYRYGTGTIHTTSHDGRSVNFPAGVLRPFVTHAGVHGEFVLRFDSNGRFHSLDRLV